MTPADLSSLRTKIERTANLATVPQFVARIRGMLEDPAASAAAVGEEIEKDHVLTAKVLKLVNSGFYGFRSAITTITQSMVLLGFDVVKTLILTASVLDILEAMNKRLVGLWEHSLGTARVADAIAGRLSMPNPEELAVAGLLHDLGKVVIAQKLPIEHARIRRIVAERGCLQFEAERVVLGVTHLEVSSWLLTKWQLPTRLIVPIAGHHALDLQGEFADRAAVVHVSDIVCRGLGLGYPGDSRIPALDPRALELLRLTRVDLEAVVMRVQREWGNLGF
jgi:putative nucleotidyltransferase with HDIG domain